MAKTKELFIRPCSADVENINKIITNHYLYEYIVCSSFSNGRTKMYNDNNL